ncbi:MAG: hypothetical protein PHR96_04500 [Clostridia bacterium]|nr:hypothetical protein [Clostridia bacterium]
MTFALTARPASPARLACSTSRLICPLDFVDLPVRLCIDRSPCFARSLGLLISLTCPLD